MRFLIKCDNGILYTETDTAYFKPETDPRIAKLCIGNNTIKTSVDIATKILKQIAVCDISKTLDLTNILGNFDSTTTSLQTMLRSNKK